MDPKEQLNLATAKSFCLGMFLRERFPKHNVCVFLPAGVIDSGVSLHSPGWVHLQSDVLHFSQASTVQQGCCWEVSGEVAFGE